MRLTKPPDPNEHFERFNEIMDIVLSALRADADLEHSQTQPVQEGVILTGFWHDQIP